MAQLREWAKTRLEMACCVGAEVFAWAYYMFWQDVDVVIGLTNFLYSGSAVMLMRGGMLSDAVYGRD